MPTHKEILRVLRNLRKTVVSFQRRLESRGVERDWILMEARMEKTGDKIDFTG